MKQSDLVRLYPWTNETNIRPFAEKFTNAQWLCINDSLIPIFLQSNIINKISIPNLFESIYICAHQPQMMARISSGEISFYDIISIQLGLIMDSHAQQNLGHPTIVLEGLEKEFPSWVEDIIELKKLANDFSDSQLETIGALMNTEIKDDRELKCALLRLVLLRTTINGQQHINECVDSDSFMRLFLTYQKEFLNTFRHNGALIGSDITTTLQRDNCLSEFSEYDSTNHSLIRKYLAEYSSPHTPIPREERERQKAFEATLRNAAKQGNLWDVLVLIKEVKNINAQRLKSRKTALHFAAEYALKTDNELCYQVLLNADGIDPSIRDKEDKTAADYRAGSTAELNADAPCVIM